MNKSAVAFTVKFIVFILLFILCAAMLWNFADRIEERSTPTEIEPIRRIIIDAGHGGQDGGAVGISGSVEKDINLSVALRMADIFNLCGVDYTMTRDDDFMLDLEGVSGSAKGRDIKSRLMIASNDPEALLVSVHTNSYPIEKYSGFQVFYSKNNPESRILAEALQSSAKRHLQPDNDREVKAAGSSIYLLHNSHNPTVLVECGFISNAAEEELLRDTKYQTSVAATICAGIMNHLNDQERT